MATTTASAYPYSTGYKRRDGAHVPLPFSLSPHSGLRAETLPRSATVKPFVPFTVDQNGSGVCFLCSPAIGVTVSCAVKAAKGQGQSLPFDVSILDGVALVHQIERAIVDPTGRSKLWDWGGDPYDVITAFSTWGVRPARYRPGTDERERNCDASPDTVGPDHEPTPEDVAAGRFGRETTQADLMKDAEALIVGAHAIPSVLDAQRSLAAGNPVGVAWRVIDSDMAAGPNTVLDADPARSAGPSNHYTLLVSYETQEDGSVRFEKLNSWGYRWGFNGYVWVTPRFMEQADCLVSFDSRRASVSGGAS